MGKVYRIGYFSPGSPSAGPHLRAAWIQALRDLRWVEGQNVAIDYRYSESRLDTLPALAVDLVQTKPDASFTIATESDGVRVMAL